MASIERLGQGRWRARWRDPSGRQKAKTFTHKNLAVKYLQGVGMAMQTSTYVDPSAGNMSVEVFAAKWISTQGHLKPSTLATYESILGKHVLPRWGSTPLARVVHEDVVAWVSDLIASDLSAATVRYVHRVFSLLLDLAVRSARIPGIRPPGPVAEGRDGRETVPEPSGGERARTGSRRLPDRGAAALVLWSALGRAGGVEGWSR